MATPGHDPGRSALVLYGTETGNAQDMAEDISHCLERLRFSTDVAGLDRVTYPQLRSYTITVLVVSTTGQGDFPTNARKFWVSLLRRKLASDVLSGINYALVGLCDSSYLQFNFAAKKLDKRLRQLGATPLLAACEADEQGEDGTDGAYLAWVDQFRAAISTTFPLSVGEEAIPPDVPLPSKARLGLADPAPRLDTEGSQESKNALPTNGTGSSSESFDVELEKNDRVTPENHWQDVRRLVLTTPHNLSYLPGDALAVSPRNMPADVAALIVLMRWHEVADTSIQMVTTRHPSSPRPALAPTHPIFLRQDLTLRMLLTEYLDINSIPRRSFFAKIAQYTPDETQRQRLLEFADPQYLDEYYDYATRPRRSIVEVLQEFDTLHLPWEEAINIFPPIRPRHFSIASGGALKVGENCSTRFELLVAIVKYKTVIKRIRQGLCTRYLAQLPTGTTLRVSLKTEGRLAENRESLASLTHLLIGAGTGIAPLRALIYEKLLVNAAPAPSVLIFGCRNEQADYFFRDEWAAISNSPPPPRSHDVLTVITAYSRDQRSKVYVQDRIRQYDQLVYDLLVERQTTVVVCGSSGRMPKEVRQGLVAALTTHAQKLVETHPDRERMDRHNGPVIRTEQDAEHFVASLEQQGRYKQETW